MTRLLVETSEMDLLRLQRCSGPRSEPMEGQEFEFKSSSFKIVLELYGSSIERVCVITNTRWRFHLSANTPVRGAKRKVGVLLIKPTTPNNKAESVNRNASQFIAICCIKVPISENPCPLKKRQ